MTNWALPNPVDTAVDPDFDSFGGELTCAQWCNPLPWYWGDKRDFQRHWRQHKLERIARRRERLELVDDLVRKRTHELLRFKRIRFERASRRLHWLLWGTEA